MFVAVRKDVCEFYVYGQFYTNKSLDNIDWGGVILFKLFAEKFKVWL